MYCKQDWKFYSNLHEDVHEWSVCPLKIYLSQTESEIHDACDRSEVSVDNFPSLDLFFGGSLVRWVSSVLPPQFNARSTDTYVHKEKKSDHEPSSCSYVADLCWPVQNEHTHSQCVAMQRKRGIE